MTSQTAASLGERKLLKEILKRIGKPGRGILTGPGDDAAVIRPSPGKDLVWTTDTLVEEIDFHLERDGYRQAGYKALAANLSDIAAMGASPRYYLLTLGFPPSTSLRQIQQIFKGLSLLEKETGISLAGGDLTEAPNLFLCLTLIGEIAKNKAVLRSGASAGDFLFVTGTLGDARAGLEILQREKRRGKRESRGLNYLVRRQLYPSPRLREGSLLSQRGLATGMMDISDGLAVDLQNFTEASALGADIVLPRLPLSPALIDYGKETGKNPVEIALTGGEDFELLFSVSSATIDRVKSLVGRKILSAALIGQLTQKREVRYLDESRRPVRISVSGFEHFKSRPS